MTRSEKSQVALPSDHEVKVTRTFQARRELVYEAHTSAALLARWQLGPPGWTMPVCEMDVRAGGKYRWRWRSDEGGQEFGFYGEFREVSPPEKLVQTQFYDPGDVGGDMGESALITTTFTERGGVTTMTSLMDFGTKAGRDAAMSTGMTDGMEQSYRLLDGVLAELA